MPLLSAHPAYGSPFSFERTDHHKSNRQQKQTLHIPCSSSLPNSPISSPYGQTLNHSELHDSTKLDRRPSGSTFGRLGRLGRVRLGRRSVYDRTSVYVRRSDMQRCVTADAGRHFALVDNLVCLLMSRGCAEWACGIRPITEITGDRRSNTAETGNFRRICRQNNGGG